MSCIRCDYSDTPVDIRHSLSINSIYELPLGPGRRFLNAGGIAGKLLGGWNLSGIAAATSGRPIDILISLPSRALPAGNSRNQRPDLVSGMSLFPPEQTINNCVNPRAVALA